MRPRQPERVSEVLSAVAGPRIALLPPDVPAAWAEAVGPTIANVAQPRRLDADGTLGVVCESAVWVAELSYLSADITARLDGRCSRPVTALKFTVGTLTRRPAPPSPRRPAIVDGRCQVLAEQLTASIADRDVRAAATRAIAASLARRPR